MKLENKYESAQELIVKDLAIENPGLTFSKLEKLQQWLAAEVRLLLDQDFHRLLNILYRIDVSEEKVKLALSGGDPATGIAGLIIERELAKVETRRKYKDNP